MLIVVCRHSWDIRWEDARLPNKIQQHLARGMLIGFSMRCKFLSLFGRCKVFVQVCLTVHYAIWELFFCNRSSVRVNKTWCLLYRLIERKSYHSTILGFLYFRWMSRKQVYKFDSNNHFKCFRSLFNSSLYFYRYLSTHLPCTLSTITCWVFLVKYFSSTVQYLQFIYEVMYFRSYRYRRCTF